MAKQPYLMLKSIFFMVEPLFLMITRPGKRLHMELERQHFIAGKTHYF